MAIEEATPPEPPAALPQPVPHPEPTRRPRRAVRTEPAAGETENSPEANEPPPTPQVPSLEPRESSAEQTALRRQIQDLQDTVRKRIANLSRTEPSGADRKTLDDARTFFEQSTRALSEGDLQRALNLARKASLLVSALER
jgi:hypothetical protein